MRKYEDLPIEEYRKKHDEYEKAGLAIPDGTEVVLTDWAEQNGLVMRKTKNNPNLIFIKVGNSTKKYKNRIKIQQGNNVMPTYYWAGFWKPKE